MARSSDDAPMGDEGGNGLAVHPTVYAFKQDAEILSRLIHDGRASLSVLASDMGENAYRQKAWRRLKELEASTIWGYTAVVDHRQLGWHDYMVVARIGKLNRERIDALRACLRSLGNDENVRLVSLQITAEDDMQWVGRFAARSSLAARRGLQALQDVAPEAFAEPPRLVEVVGTVVSQGKLNPDTEFLDHLYAEWME